MTNEIKPISELMLKIIEPHIKRVDITLERGLLPNRWKLRHVAITNNGEKYLLGKQSFSWNPKNGDLNINQDIPYRIDLSSGSRD